MSNSDQIGRASRTCTCAALCPPYHPGLAGQIGRPHAGFFRVTGKISKQHSSKGYELYLFVGSLLVWRTGLATACDVISTARGGAAKVPLVQPDRRQTRLIDHRPSGKLADLVSSVQLSAESIRSNRQSQALMAGARS
jgi:hypothetical protein